MRLEGFPKLAVNIITKDWKEYKLPVFGIAGMTVITAVLTMILSPGSNFAKGTLIGVGFAGAYGLAQGCFFNERQRGTLMLLLSLPVTPVQLVLAKYASAFSMALFALNAPGMFLGDLRFVFYANMATLLLTSICMAATVLSDKAWAPQLPLWIVMIIMLPAPHLLRHRTSFLHESAHWLISHDASIAGFTLLLIAVIVYGSACIFAKRFSA
jgi:hypothetical protein